MAISIDRLSGGNTPADGSDPRTFPAIWNATAAILEENVGTGGGGSITVSDTAPTDPAPENGDLWWNSADGKMFVYYVDGDSSQWVDAAGPSVAVQSTAPTGYEGQLWLDDTDGSMYVYYTDPGGGSSQWIGAVSRSGGILQVVSTTKTDQFTSTSTSFADITGLTASITPRSTSSKILVSIQVNGVSANAVSTSRNFVRIARDGTGIAVGDAEGSRIRSTVSLTTRSVADNIILNGAMTTLDSPSTTSTLTYSVQCISPNGGTLYINREESSSNAIGDAVVVSSITLMEVAG